MSSKLTSSNVAVHNPELEVVLKKEIPVGISRIKGGLGMLEGVMEVFLHEL